MPDTENMKIIHVYIDAYNRFDIDAMLAVLHDNVVFRNFSNGKLTHETRGLAQFRAQAQTAAAMFSHRQQTVISAHETGTGIIVSIRYAGTLSQDLPNGMTSGETIELDGQSEFQFKDGKIVFIADRS